MDIDIVIAELQNSTLPTVFVEGKDDMLIYRKFEQLLGTTKVSFYPCGGRTRLLDLYERRNEFANLKAIFVADKDMYVFTEIPKIYENVIFTTGYSIENDLYADARDTQLDKIYLENHELPIKENIKNSLLTWFAFEVEKYKENLENEIDNEMNFAAVTILSTNVMHRNSLTFTTEFLQTRNFQTPKDEILMDLQQNYAHKLRGKYLFQIYELIFQIRQATNKKEITFTKGQLFLVCFKEGMANDNGFMKSIFDKISDRL
jgi:hypothetical protein